MQCALYTNKYIVRHINVCLQFGSSESTKHTNAIVVRFYLHVYCFDLSPSLYHTYTLYLSVCLICLSFCVANQIRTTANQPTIHTTHVIYKMCECINEKNSENKENTTNYEQFKKISQTETTMSNKFIGSTGHGNHNKKLLPIW